MSSAPLTLTARAAQRILTLGTANQDGNAMLRIAVLGGGCSGFQYQFDLVSQQETDDEVIERDGAVVLIDPISIRYLLGSEIDFADELIGQSFKINNPNAVASCGCGVSFSL